MRIKLLTLSGAIVLFAAACDTATPVEPSASAALSFQKVGAECAVDVGETEYPLPAVHDLALWINDALESSTLNCGQVRSLDAKMEAIATALDKTPPDFHAACGASGALESQMTALAGAGQLATPSFQPFGPEGPTFTILTAADFLNGRWCAAARGEVQGPRS
jgi:hypothetical protein